jgi:hypothetical protein
MSRHSLNNRLVAARCAERPSSTTNLIQKSTRDFFCLPDMGQNPRSKIQRAKWLFDVIHRAKFKAMLLILQARTS